MAKILTQLYCHLRQRTFPAEFRIDATGAVDWEGALAAIIAALRVGPPPPPPGDGVNPNFALGLCNYYFRLQRNAKLLGDDSFELERIHDTLEDIADLLRKYDIECRDLTGQDYDPRNEDFEPLGEPQPRPGLRQMKIGDCERPAVFLRGQLRQRAKGFVLKPQ